MEETAIMTQSFGFSNVAACNAMWERLNEGIRNHREQESHLQSRRVAPTSQETIRQWENTAGKQDLPRWLGMEVTGLWDTNDLY